MPEENGDGKVINIESGRAMQWFGKMLECVENLSPEERAGIRQVGSRAT